MNALNLFALKSFVSVLTETEKETTLKIVGGWKPLRDLNVNKKEDWPDIDKLYEEMCQHPFPTDDGDNHVGLEVNRSGDVVEGHCGTFSNGPSPFGHEMTMFNKEGWEAYKELMKDKLQDEDQNNNDNRDNDDSHSEDNQGREDNNPDDGNDFINIPNEDNEDDENLDIEEGTDSGENLNNEGEAEREEDGEEGEWLAYS